jgi:hypothetical protein
MEDRLSQEYVWYVRGCATLRWSPLDEDGFVDAYGRYLIARDFLKDYGYRINGAFGLPRVLLKLRFARAVRGMQRLEQSLGFVATALHLGKGGADDGQGAGVRRVPSPPGISGCGAEPRPPLAVDRSSADCL